MTFYTKKNYFLFRFIKEYISDQFISYVIYCMVYTFVSVMQYEKKWDVQELGTFLVLVETKLKIDKTIAKFLQ